MNPQSISSSSQPAPSAGGGSFASAVCKCGHPASEHGFYGCDFTLEDDKFCPCGTSRKDVIVKDYARLASRVAALEAALEEIAAFTEKHILSVNGDIVVAKAKKALGGDK